MSFLILVCVVIPGAIGLCVGGFLIPVFALVVLGLAAGAGTIGIIGLLAAMASPPGGSGALGVSLLSLALIVGAICLALGTYVGTLIS